MATHRIRHFATLAAGACLFAASTASAQQGVYLEENGLLVCRIESAPDVDDWTFSNSTGGFAGDGYFRWDGPNLFTQPGASGVFGYDFELSTGGTWTLSLRNRHEHPDPTEENDCWIRMDGGPWQKVFSNGPQSVGGWTWESRVDLHNGQFPQASYNLGAGLHRVEFAGRSHGFKMDRFHLHLGTVPGFHDPSRPESQRRFGTAYCSASPNSTGQSSQAYALGSPLVSENDVELICNNLPPAALGYFIVSPNSAFVPNAGNSSGNLCIGTPTGRYAGTVLSSGANGRVAMDLDLTQIPHPSGVPTSVMAGDTLRFQFWHRDISQGNVTSNFSRGLRTIFE